MNRVLLFVLSGAAVVACTPPAKPCSVTTDCSAGQSCVAGQCRAGSFGGGVTGSVGGGSASVGGGDGSTGGGGGRPVVTGCDPAASDNASRDTDCDGLTDLEEYGTDYGGGARTDPCNGDSDGDALPDGLEMGKMSTVNATCGALFVADADPSSKTNPTQEDSDSDGLKDGQEDTNQDGRRQTTETSPLRADTDCDGYSDKQERDMAAGCATDPTLKDSDADGLPDGVEGKLQAPGVDPQGCMYTAATFDADPATGTNACNADSDGDGVADGAEDTNSNGRLDLGDGGVGSGGELNPNDGMDTMGPAQLACSTANLRPISFHSSGAADVQVALVPQFTEISRLTLGGDERGVAFFNPTTRVGGIAFSKTMGVAATASAEETNARGPLGQLGTIATPLTQTFTSWDGFGGVRATYDVSSNRDAKEAVNELARRFLGMQVGGLLTGTAGTTGPFKVQAVFVRRTATRAVTVIALIPQSLHTGAALFELDDVGGGTALAQAGDLTATQCEAFTATANAKVDFLWVVDDSCSMASSQDAVRSAGSTFGAKLTAAGLDWRAAAVTTGYFPNSYNGSTREWTDMATTMSSWFNQASGGGVWFGTGGSGNESGFPSVRAFINRTGPQQRGPFRADSNVNLIFLSDTGDQSNISAPNFTTELRNAFPGRQVLAHGIACPAGQDCGDGSQESNPATYGTVVQNTGGVLGTILEFNVPNPNATQRARQEAIIDAILSAAIGGTGRQLNRPPISATIKVAIDANATAGACTTADVPRSRQNGWDIDAATRRIVFYGTCRPNQGARVAVSYRYWIDNSPDANGDPCAGTCVAPMTCDQSTRSCVCSQNCGNTCGSGFTCNMTTCACDPEIQ